MTDKERILELGVRYVHGRKFHGKKTFFYPLNPYLSETGFIIWYSEYDDLETLIAQFLPQIQQEDRGPNIMLFRINQGYVGLAYLSKKQAGNNPRGRVVFQNKIKMSLRERRLLEEIIRIEDTAPSITLTAWEECTEDSYFKFPDWVTNLLKQGEEEGSKTAVTSGAKMVTSESD
jgi:hypothetical protein